jgi:outer membrane protein TolC
LRKERADLKLAKLKLKDTEYEMISTKVTLQNKIQALKKELASLSVQNSIFEDVLEDYEQMLTAEERKFTLGESSLFLVNSREGKLIDAKLKAIELQNKLLSSKALLFNKLALNPNL